MHHDEFYNLGASIAFNSKCSPSEIEIRNAIGRIYYYVYHEVLEWVQGDEALSVYFNNSEEKSSHLKLRDVFLQISQKDKDTKFGKVYRLLADLHKSRCICDYKLTHEVTKDFLDTFEAVLSEFKEECIKLKPEILKLVPYEEFEDIAEFKAPTYNAVVRKKPSLKILD